MWKKKSSNDSAQPLRHENHAKPVTRRQFLAQGFLSGSAMITAPSLLSFFASPSQALAQAADCGLASAPAAGKIPFIGFDLAGGASIAGSNVMVGGQGGQLDFISAAGYEKLGLPSGMLPSLPNQLNTSLGLAFHADSAILRGILSKASAGTLANTNGVVIAARSENDTGNNPHNPVFGIAKAGASGQLVTLIGTRSSDSGGRSRAPDSQFDATLRPTKVDRPEDALGLVDTGTTNAQEQADSVKVMQAIERISALKVAKLTEAQVVKSLLSCGYAQSAALVSQFGDPTQLDPRLDTRIAQIFPGDELGQDKFRKTASVMKLVLNGFAGAGTVEFGGYDYHNSTRATGEVRDFEAGQAIGATLEYAAQLGKPLMVYVFSDGSVSSNGEIDDSANGRGKGIWKGDSSSTASVFFLVYNPNGRAQLVNPTRQQLGFFRADGSLETAATPISNNVDQLAEAIVLNYLALNNEVGRFRQVLPNATLPASSLDSLIAFQPIV